MVGNFGGWLFQCNPRMFQIFRAVADGEPLDNWSVKQHRDKMKAGDRSALWIGGGEPGYTAGVYAVGTIRSLSWSGVVDRRYWVAQQPGPRQFVDIDFDRWFFHHPIGVDELKRDADFMDAPILRMARATNFLLTTDQWLAIERRIARRRPTPYPTLARHVESLEP